MFKNNLNTRNSNRAEMFRSPDKQKVALAYDKKKELIEGLETSLNIKFNLEDTITRFEFHSGNYNGFFIRIGGSFGSEMQTICIMNNKTQAVIYLGDANKGANYYCKLINATRKASERG